jgi:hypothetical protein
MAKRRSHQRCAPHSRRCLLQILMLAASGGSVLADDVPPPTTTAPHPNSGTTWHKFSKQVAGYVDRGKRGPETCGMCHYFLDPDQCVLVEGPVNPATGWCNYGATTG